MQKFPFLVCMPFCYMSTSRVHSEKGKTCSLSRINLRKSVGVVYTFIHTYIAMYKRVMHTLSTVGVVVAFLYPFMQLTMLSPFHKPEKMQTEAQADNQHSSNKDPSSVHVSQGFTFCSALLSHSSIQLDDSSQQKRR